MPMKHLNHYKDELDVIRSFRRCDLMHDELLSFINNDPPAVTSLHKLGCAIGDKFNYRLRVDRNEHYLKYLPGYVVADDEIDAIIAGIIIIELENLDLQKNGASDEEWNKLNDTYDISYTNEPNDKSNVDCTALKHYRDPKKTFLSKLSIEELKVISERLVEEGFITSSSVDAFIRAFSYSPIDKKNKIQWISTYNGRNDNISLVLLLKHLSPEELDINIQPRKVLAIKIYEIFSLAKGGPLNKRTIEDPLKKVQNTDYTITARVSLLLSILQPYIH